MTGKTGQGQKDSRNKSGREIKQNCNLNKTVKKEFQERARRMEQAGKSKSPYITEYSGHNRQDIADRTAQIGDKRQVRTTRTRKTGSGNLNHTIGTWFCQQQRVSHLLGFSLNKKKYSP